jgi:ketosteroid isomerase-like protein
MYRMLSAIVCGVMVSGCAARVDVSDDEVRTILNGYVQAVNQADFGRLRAIWLEDGTSYISPIQRVTSPAELENFWRTFLREGFSQRELKPQNVAIHTGGDSAWVAFDWDFIATRTDGQPYHARGWETHVYERTPNGLRLAHVHYSVRPQ